MLCIKPLGTLWADTPQCCLRGIVIDIETNEPVDNAIVEIAGQNLQTKTDTGGLFSFSGLAAGEYDLKIFRIGYKDKAIQIDYNPNEDKKIAVYVFPKAIEASPVIVTGERNGTRFEELSELSDVLGGRELQKELGHTIASTLKNETGLAMRSMGPAPARPVIRGLGGDRVLISEDGNKTTDLSATSPDHAVTIEPFTLERLEVIRGPKVLTKTSTTIGGIVNVVRNEIPTEIHDNIYGTLGAYGESANDGSLGSFIAEVPINPLAIRMEMSRRQSADLDTPEGALDNSDAENLDYSLGTGYIGNSGYIGGSYRYFDLEYGIPGGFVGAHPNGVRIDMLKRQFNLKARYHLNHDTYNSIETHLSRAYYRHKEFESNGSIGSEFKVINYLGYANLKHSDLGVFDNGNFGLSFEYRDYDIGGFVFNPPTKSLNLAAYLYETFRLDKFSFEAALRYDYNSVNPEEDDPDSEIGYIRERTFNTFSASVSALYDFSESFATGATLSKSSRAPTIEELFSEGPHLAAYSYETGNPDLESESGIGSELFAYYKSDRFYFMSTIFYDRLSDYIIQRNTGEINYATFLPVYASSSVSARLYGAESQIELKFTDHLSLSNSISYTRGEFEDNDAPLPQIPPLKGQAEIKYANDRFGLGLSAQWAARQDRVDEFEEPTAGYVVYGSYFQYQLSTSGTIHSITLNFDNILDTPYRNHLSRIKSILPEAGRNIRLTYKMFFDI
ncbi:MAG: TonB-dependent receptor [candidate division Zixibacteria bacterium]|nr:TonB-dependent receptor [candidate division Zixibacteria bacterium]